MPNLCSSTEVVDRAVHKCVNLLVSFQALENIILELPISVPSELLQVLCPHTAKLAALTGKVEACYCNLRWWVTSCNFIVFSQEVAEMLGILSDLHQCLLRDLLFSRLLV